MKVHARHSHAEGAGDAGHLAADVAGADYAYRLALEHHVLHQRPAPRLQLGGLERRALGRREHEADNVLGDDGRGASRLVADDNAELTRNLYIDHVDADGARGDHPQLRERSEGLGGPIHGAAGIDNDVGVFHALELLLHVLGAVQVHVNIAVGLEAGQVRRPLDLRRVVARHDKLQPAVRHVALPAAGLGQPSVLEKGHQHLSRLRLVYRRIGGELPEVRIRLERGIE